MSSNGHPAGYNPKRRAHYGPGTRSSNLHAFADMSLRELKTRGEVAVWIVLLDAANFGKTKKAIAKIGHKTIAIKAGVTRRHAQRIITQLEAKGLVRTVRKGGMRGGPNTYEVLGWSPDIYSQNNTVMGHGRR